MMREEYRSKDTEIEELRKRKIDLTSQLEAVTSRYNRDSKDLRDRLMVKRITKDGLEVGRHLTRGGTQGLTGATPHVRGHTRPGGGHPASGANTPH